MMNFLQNLLRGTINILLTIVVVKVMFNYFRFGTLFSRKRMMYKMAKMRVDKRGGFKKSEKPKEYYEYKVYRAEKRKEMAMKCWNYAVQKNNERKAKHLLAQPIEPTPYVYKTVDFSVFETYDPECLQYMD